MTADMRGSVTIAEIFGTKVRMHLTFLLLLVWIAAAEGLTQGPRAAASGVVFVLLLFACVVAHEFGHVLVARHYGGRTRDILILPIGGISRMERIPEGPLQELAVALAGPLVSIAIAAVIAGIAGLPTAHSLASPEFAALPGRLAATNLVLALFNLLPAFPMDGGRALRALIALRLGRVRATEIAARLGQVFALFFAVIGLVYGNAIIVLIAIFIYFGGGAEAADAELRHFTRGLTASDAMRTNVRLLPSTASLGDAVALMLEAGQHAIPVVNPEGSVAGIATRENVSRAIHHQGRGGSLIEAVETNFSSVPGEQPLNDVIDLIESASAPAVLVIGSGGRLAGMLTADSVADLMLMEHLYRGAENIASSRQGARGASRHFAPRVVRL